jgi:glutaminase
MTHTLPEPEALQRLLEALHRKYLPLQAGQVANYIPELAKTKPDLFAICIATLDGQVYGVGNLDHRFTMQSISKVFVQGLALEDHGRDYVLARVGVEPSGDSFNAIVLDEQSKRPYNPMVNAGAIATTSLIKGHGPIERLNRLLEMFERYTGHDVFVDMSIFLSERMSGHRNRAIAHLMRNFGMIDEPLEESLDLYFQQCAVMVTCHDLAIMAATLANHGMNPITRKQAIPRQYVPDLLSVMYTCGMYNYAGEWAYRVGIPAKSGISGGLLAVVPNRMGIGTFLPYWMSEGTAYGG